MEIAARSHWAWMHVCVFFVDLLIAAVMHGCIGRCFVLVSHILCDDLTTDGRNIDSSSIDLFNVRMA